MDHTLQHTPTHSNTLEDIFIERNPPFPGKVPMYYVPSSRAATHCNTLQHTTTHCFLCTMFPHQELQHTATHYNTLQHTVSYVLCSLIKSCNTLQHTATHDFLCTMFPHQDLQHTATHYNTLQHTVSYVLCSLI